VGEKIIDDIIKKENRNFSDKEVNIHILMGKYDVFNRIGICY
jgi:hypothetical protein